MPHAGQAYIHVCTQLAPTSLHKTSKTLTSNFADVIGRTGAQKLEKIVEDCIASLTTLIFSLIAMMCQREKVKLKVFV